MVLAALGERDEEIAAANPEPFSPEQCSVARRQALGVWVGSLVTGAAVTAVIWVLAAGRHA